MSNMQHYVITGTGPDRVGLVSQLTRGLTDLGANVEESRMARLGGEFSIILLIALPEDKAKKLQPALEKIPLEFHIKLTTPFITEEYTGYVPYEILVTGADHEGIIHSVSDYLSKKKINIVSLETEVIPAPVTGTPMFTMHILIHAPAIQQLSALRRELARIGDELGTDIEVRIPVNK